MDSVLTPVLFFLFIGSSFEQNGLFDKTKYTGIGETPEYWKQSAKQTLHDALGRQDITNKAKNVILFIGDGMGVSTLTPARILKGQMQNKSGEEEHLSWDRFPHVAFSKTYNQDYQTPDSAGTATAFLSGVKTNMYVLGVDARARIGDCASAQGAEVYSIGKWSLEEGKKVGVISTTRVTHATPGALYAHTPHRDWEGDVNLPKNGAENCKDIASQLIDDNPDISVILGGGRRYFLPYDVEDFERGSNSKLGRRDGRNLITEWQNKKKARNLNYRFVWNSTEFNKVDPKSTDYLLGLFDSSHMQFEADRLDPKYETAGEPSLAEMTEKAIRILRKDPDGFFLLVEGGRIDHGHHETHAYKALRDTVAMDEAVAKAVEITSELDTLIVVTADHSHAFAMGGYPTRGNPILGLTDKFGDVALDNDNYTYTTLVYGNGPGVRDHRPNNNRRNLTKEETMDKEYRQITAFPLGYETHGGEDVGIFARGPWSHLFFGVHEQSYIPHVMAFASCVGDYRLAKDCAASYSKPNPVNQNPSQRVSNKGSNNFQKISFTSYVWLLLIFIFLK